jgi:flagellar biosynthesis protein
MAELRKPTLAIALRYAPGDHAPVVTAKGRYAIAETIVLNARAAGVPVHESPELAQMLMPTELESPIPPQLFRLVAEVLAWVYEAEKRHPAAAATRPRAPPQS